MDQAYIANMVADNEAGIRYSLRRIIRGHKWLEDDVLQEARIFLMYCAEKYDPNRNSSFMNFYAKILRHKVRRFILDYARCSRIKLSLNYSKLFYQSFRIERKAFIQGDESEANKRKLAIDMGVNEEWLSKKCITTLLDRTNYSEKPDYQFNEDVVCVLAEPTYLGFTPNQEDRMNSIDCLRIMEEFMSTLNDRNAEIFRLRFVEDDPPTLKSIGDTYGISRERARQLEAKLIIKFREFCEENEYI